MAHDLDVDDNTMKYKYYYHLSDDIMHDYAFTSYVIEHLLEVTNSKEDKLVRFKSDNCSVQYKSKGVFNFWRELSKSCGKTVIVYYGVAGHGKGTVDAMSGFGVKDPIRKAIVQEDFFFNSSEDVYNYLLKNKASDKMNYYLIDKKDLDQRRKVTDTLPIKEVRKQHIVFKPDGAVYTKENLCSCDLCIKGDVLTCPQEKAVIIYNADDERDDVSDEEDYADEYEEEDVDRNEMEEYEMRNESIIDVITDGSVIALYSHENASELFYLCKVL